MFVDDLTTHLDSNSTKISAGTTLYKNAVPESTGRVVCVVETPGLPAIERFGSALPAMTQPRAQIVTRSTASAGGQGIASSTATRSLAQDMWEIVVGTKDQSINGVYYQRLTPLQDPFLLHHDEKGRAVFVFTVQAMRTATTN